MKMLSDLPNSASFKEQQLDLDSLVFHRESMAAGTTIEAVYAFFQSHDVEYIGITGHGRAVGMVSRGHVGFLLGSRFGFAIYGRQPVGQHLLPDHLTVTVATPLIELLDLALSREGELFYDDVMLTDEQGGFKGIIQVQTLVRLQTRLIADTTRQVEVQRKTLAERNRALTESLDELRRSRGRYDILFQNSVLGVALLNRRCEVESRNRRFSVLLGLEGDQPVNLCDLIIPADRQAFLVLMKRQEEDGEEDSRPAMAHSGEFRFQLPRLGQRQFKLFVNWIGETGQLSVLLEDVSEQRLLERKLAQKEKSNLLESLVGGIAHELNNKLTPILAFSEMVIEDLQTNVRPEVVGEHCDAMRKSANEAARIIRQLLQLSQPPKMEMARCGLRPLVEDAITTLTHRFRQTDVAREILVPETGAVVLGDAQQLKQVLINLMLNSLDAMEKRPQRVLRIEVTRENGCCLLSITDTGCGIDPKHLPRVFDPFFTTKSPDRGTGLGLSVCYNIVKQHGGDLTVHSTLGQGTQIRMKLPAATDALPVPAGSQDRARTRTKPERRLDQARRILLVDDEDAIATFLRVLIKRSLGCDPEYVQDGKQAIQRLEESDFDLIISDVRMPHVNGLELFRWVRANRKDKVGRFVFITGDAGSTDLNVEIETLGVPILRKPFSKEVFVAQCELLLQS